jgi:hypothetical protein
MGSTHATGTRVSKLRVRLNVGTGVLQDNAVDAGIEPALLRKLPDPAELRITESPTSLWHPPVW